MMEHFDIKVIIFEIIPFMISKIYVITKNILNFNVIVIRVLQIFLKALGKSESQCLQLDLLSGGGIKSKEEITLHFINYTGVRINILFEGNYACGFGLDPKGFATFIRIQLFFTRGLYKKNL